MMSNIRSQGVERRMKIAMLVSHDPQKDPRVHWAAGAVAEKCDLAFMGIGTRERRPLEDGFPYRIERVPLKRGSNEKWLAENFIEAVVDPRRKKAAVMLLRVVWALAGTLWRVWTVAAYMVSRVTAVVSRVLRLLSHVVKKAGDLASLNAERAGVVLSKISRRLKKLLGKDTEISGHGAISLRLEVESCADPEEVIFAEVHDGVAYKRLGAIAPGQAMNKYEFKMRARDLHNLKTRRLLFHLVTAHGGGPSKKHKIRSLSLFKEEFLLGRISLGKAWDSDRRRQSCSLICGKGYMNWSRPRADEFGGFRYFMDCGGIYSHAPFEFSVANAIEKFSIKEILRAYGAIRRLSSLLNDLNIKWKSIRYHFAVFRASLNHVATSSLSVLRGYETLALKADIIQSNDLDTLLAGVLIKKKDNCRLVYDAHELYPVSIPTFPSYWTAMLRFYEKRLVKYADAVVTVSPQLGRTMEEWYGIPKVRIAPNAVLLSADDSVMVDKIKKLKNEKKPIGFLPVCDELLKLADGRPIFLFQGIFAKERGLEELIQAWQNINRDEALLALRGSRWRFTEELEFLARDQIRNGKIVFLPPVKEEELVAAAAVADVGIIPYRPVSLNNKYCCPNKLSQYMHSGIAIMANKLEFVNSVIEKYECGVTYDSDNPATIVSAVRKLTGDRDFLERLKNNALKNGREHFHWNAVCGPMMEAYAKNSRSN